MKRESNELATTRCETASQSWTGTLSGRCNTIRSHACICGGNWPITTPGSPFTAKAGRARFQTTPDTRERSGCTGGQKGNTPISRSSIIHWQLITGNVFTDPPVEREVPKRIEIEVSQKSIADLGFTDKGLSEESKQKINEVRLGLQTDFGFALPFLNFRDNSAFEQGFFRFLIRGVPVPLENLPAGAAPAVQWDMLAQRIKETALSYASCSYTSQDCYMQVKRMAKERSEEHTSELQSLR